MRYVTVPSPVKIYAAAGAWLVYALIFPLYLWYHFVIALAVSLMAYLAAKRLKPTMKVLRPIPARVFVTGDKDTDAFLREGERLLREIDRANARIPDKRVSERADQIVALGDKMIAYIEQNTDKAPRIRRFINYYLPTVLKLLNHYDVISKQDIEGENITGSIQKIEQMLDAIVPAFQKQLDGLFMNEALDISTDITVLENMLAQEGLSEGKNAMPRS